LTIPLVAGLRPVRRLVYLCALVLKLGRSFLEQVAADAEIYHPVRALAPGSRDRSRWHGLAPRRGGGAGRLRGPEDGRWAFSHLRP